MKTTWFLLDVGETNPFMAFDALPTGCLLLENEKIKEINSYLANLLGGPKTEFIGQPVDTYISGEGSIMNLLIKAIDTPQNVQLNLITNTGKEIKVSVQIKTQEAEEKNSYSSLLTISQIDTGAQPLVSSDSSEDLATGPVSGTSVDGTVIINPNYNITYFNKRAEELYKSLRDKDLVKGGSILDYVGKEEAVSREEIFKAVLRGETKIIKLTFDKVAQRYFRVSYSPFYDEDMVVKGIVEVFQEITEDVDFQNELFNKQLMLSSILHMSDNFFIYYNRNYEVVYFNQLAYDLHKEILNKDLNECKDVIDLYGQAGADFRKEKYFSLALEEKVVKRKFNYKKDGVKRYVDITYKVMRNLNGEIIGFLEFGEEVTSIINAEKKRLNTEMTLQLLIDNSSDTFIAYDNNLDVLFYNVEANKSYKEIYGTELQEGLSFESIFSKEADYKEKLKEYKSIISQDRNINRLVTKETTGGQKAINFNLRCLRDVNGKLLGVLESSKDMTEIIDYNNKLNESNSIIRSIMENSQTVFMVLDTDMKVKYLNKHAQERYKKLYNVDISIGTSIDKISSDSKRNKGVVAIMDRLMNEREVIVREAKTAVGEGYIYETVTYLPLFDENKDVTSILVKMDDITEQKYKSAEIIRSNATLKAVIDSSNASISAFSKDYEVQVYNKQAYQDYKEYANVQLDSELSLKEQLGEEEFARLDSLYSRVFDGETINLKVERSAGGKTFQNTYTPVLDESNTIIGALEMSSDITADLKKRQDLVLSEQRFRSLIENTPTGIARLGLNGVFKYISPKGVSILGYKNMESLIGKKVTELIVEREHKKIFRDIQLLVDGQKQVSNSFTLLSEDNKVVRIDGVASLIKAKEGDEFLLAFNDVSEKHEAQVLLDVTKSHYEYLFHNMKEGVALFDLTTLRIVEWNHAALELSGYSFEEIAHLEYTELLVSHTQYMPDMDFDKKLNEVTEKLRAGENVFDFRSGLLTKSGELKLVNCSIVLTDENSGKAYFIINDMTERFLADKDLVETNAVYEALIYNSSEGIDIVQYNDNEGMYEGANLVVRNDIMAQIVDEKYKVLDGLEPLLTISPEFQPNGMRSEDMLRDVIKKTVADQRITIDYRFQVGDKSIDVAASVLMIKLHGKVYLIKNFRDITAEVRQRNTIKNQLEVLNGKNDELKKYIESNLQLENFAYIASHDLKAPIRSVISFAQLLKNNTYKDMDAKNQRFLDIMITASVNMQVLIDDLLSFSRINTQKIEFENVNIDKLIKHLLIEIDQNISEANGEVIISDMPESIVADASRLRQVFQNLITNAMKFHKEGETPRVEIDCEDHEDNYKFKVKDYGIGVEQNYLTEIFLMFKKLHSENKYKGTGIGLSICKKIVEQHQGDIWAKSKLGEGTCFYFTISKDLDVNI